VDLSFIVSAYDRPEHLICCLASLALQDGAETEIIVTDNSNDPTTQAFHREYCEQLGARYIHTGLPGCYHSAEVGAQYASGAYLSFPSDDSYYVASFAEVMLKAAHERELDLAYCEMLYSPRWPGDKYRLLGVEPRLNKIDKTGWLIRRSKFYGFPDKGEGQYCAADGMLIERLVADPSIKHGFVDSCLVVHS
jgi:glycosyltransferase involved in cell wall biosynthesis